MSSPNNHFNEIKETLQPPSSASAFKQESLRNKKIALDILTSVAKYEKTNQVKE